MKNFFYTLVTVLALAVLVGSYQGPLARQAMAQTPGTTVATPASPAAPGGPGEPGTVLAPSVTGDLVIDFMGAQRGYVEPCG